MDDFYIKLFIRYLLYAHEGDIPNDDRIKYEMS